MTCIALRTIRGVVLLGFSGVLGIESQSVRPLPGFYEGVVTSELSWAMRNAGTRPPDSEWAHMSVFAISPDTAEHIGLAHLIQEDGVHYKVTFRAEAVERMTANDESVQTEIHNSRLVARGMKTKP